MRKRVQCFGDSSGRVRTATEQAMGYLVAVATPMVVVTALIPVILQVS